MTDTDIRDLRAIVLVSERAIVEPRGEETLSCRQLLILALPYLKRALQEVAT
jgi:hypothetical protein